MTKLQLKKSLAALALMACLSPVVGAGAQGYDFKKESGLLASGGAAGYDILNPTSVNNLIGQIILIGLSLVGIAFLGYLLYGGLTWMTARDNADKVQQANGIILNALLGFIVTLAAYALTYFLIQYFSLPVAEEIQTQF